MYETPVVGVGKHRPNFAQRVHVGVSVCVGACVTTCVGASVGACASVLGEGCLCVCASVSVCVGMHTRVRVPRVSLRLCVL